MEATSLLHNIHTLTDADMLAVDDVIRTRLHSDIELINQIAHHIIESGGKRLRPQLLILSARALGYRGVDHIAMAAVIEFIHTATLLHDDVVDAGTLRRGHATANRLWGNQASILVGDFLYSRAFQMMVDIRSIPIMALLADVTNTIAEAEVMQLQNNHNPTITEHRYFETIRRKTAILFQAAAQVGALLAKATTEDIHNMATYGLNLGMAFQLVDDALDYQPADDRWGKNCGDDLAEGKPTLPIIFALKTAGGKEKALLENAIKTGDRNCFPEVLAIVASSGALDYTYQSAAHYAKKAREMLPSSADSPCYGALNALTQFVVDRGY